MPSKETYGAQVGAWSPLCLGSDLKHPVGYARAPSSYLAVIAFHPFGCTILPLQPPIELLRQFMDYDGWYGRDNVFRNMVDVQFVAAMGPPGGGRTFISNRYTRHFNNLGLANVSVYRVLHT